MKTRDLAFLVAMTLSGLGTAKEVGAEIVNQDKSQAEKKEIPIMLEIVRDTYTDSSTTGRLYYDANRDGKFVEDELIGYTLEPAWKNNEIGKSCIPEGTYPLFERSSPKFGKHLILGETGKRDLILIHAGNYPKNTQGCILPGITRGKDYVGNSRVALQKLLEIKKQHGNMAVRIINSRR